MWISICKALKVDPWQDTNICCCYDCPFRFYFHFETILSLQKSCENISEFRLPFAQLPLMLKPPTTIGWWSTMLFSHSVLSDSFATPWTVAPPGSSVHGISSWLKWVAISFSRGSSRRRDQTRVLCIGTQILYHWATREAWINHIV